MVSNSESLLLARALSSRLAHDLALPLTIARNGLDVALEIINDKKEDYDFRDFLAMADNGIERAIVTLKFLRIALGQGAVNSDFEELGDLARRFLTYHHTTLAWPDNQAFLALATASHDQQTALKWVASAILRAADALPTMGAMSVGAGDNPLLEIRMSGPRACWPARSDRDIKPNAQSALPILLASEMQAAGINLICDMDGAEPKLALWRDA